MEHSNSGDIFSSLFWSGHVTKKADDIRSSRFPRGQNKRQNLLLCKLRLIYKTFAPLLGIEMNKLRKTKF